MTNDPEDEQKIKLNRGMKYMLQNKKQLRREFFRFIMDKSFSFFNKEIQLTIKFKIIEK
jgi:hypothetical protein